MDWTRRVNELYQLARDYHANATATVDEYDNRAEYIDDLLEFIFEDNPELTKAERDVIGSEVERLVLGD